MENNNLTLGSLFDGSGGFPLGGLISGITPLWASEVEPFPIRVTTKRLPNIQHFGDVSKLNGAEVPPVDIITFGSPCQDMSVAGKRSGLDGERSILFYQAVRIVKEMRCKTNGKYPRFVVWENVPGAFSSHKGEDFRAVLEEICKIKDEGVSIPKSDKWTKAGEIVGDGFSAAWRVLDAQFWGVPQRRKRIYLVADFAGGCAGKILFESEGLSRYSKESFCSWQGTARNVKESIGETGTICLNDQGGNRMDVTEDVTSTLRASSGHPPLVFENHSQDTRYNGPLNTAPTVSSTYGTGGNNQPFVVETPKTLKIRSGCEGGGKGALIQEDLSATLGCNNDQTVFVPKAYGVCSKDSNSMKSTNPKSGFYEADTSRTIDANGGNPACNQGGIMVVEGNGSRPSHKGDGYKESDVMYTLNTIEQHAVVYAIDRESYNCGRNYARKMGITEDGINSTLNAQGPSAVAVPTYSMTTGNFMQINHEKAPTLAARDYKDPPIINDIRTASGKDVFGTLAASMGSKQWLGNQEAFSGDYHILEQDYIVRRLTPTECARLQGFPDWWCSDLGTANPTKEEIKWWSEVFETHRHIMGKSTKPKSEKQIIKWLRNPHSDSTEYKMWGNGVALPNVVFVLSGIVYYSQFPTQ
ncbi:DNA cytosine methyltransferase [uncultured Clostridium sp.]|uniref:DNA cytosine methyltransferase n=1 Tax=uncultured Clostridium sp. TaxID=59620 RepID=UPI0025FE92F7|nr:DNA (cytosine-5-)-methyltransferase [uncultured Clostridium sp.]